MVGTFIQRGNQGFERAVNSEIYVDKTDMIDFLNSRVNTEQSCICVSRPRRFGKSVTANMIAAYFDKSCDSRYLFEKRKLGYKNNWEKYLNRFEVIRIDMAEVCSRVENVDLALEYIREKLYKDLGEVYKECTLKKNDDIATWLSDINHESNNQFVIIIDEWDCLFRDEKSNEKIHDEYFKLLRSLFKGDGSKDFLAMAYITGILPIKRYNSESALNNFYEYTMLEPAQLAPYIGFTMNEVKELCNQYDMDCDKMLEWYDGYLVGEEHHVCGPNSIVRAIDNKKYSSYWSKTVAFDSLKEYITMNFDGLKDAIKVMLSGQKIKVKTMGYQNDMTSFCTKDDVLTLLIHLGYLAYDAETSESYIPNKEVREYFEATIERTGWDELIRTIDDSDRLLKATLNMDAETVAQMVDESHMKNTSILKYNDENSLACCVSLAYYTARNEYTIIREFPTGYGFADLVFIPKKKVAKPAIVVELKWNKNVDTAIQQIKEKKYVESLRDYSGEVILVGISYDEKGKDSKKHICKIEKIEKK